jgi:SAM-dependent methyltransferase
MEPAASPGKTGRRSRSLRACEALPDRVISPHAMKRYKAIAAYYDHEYVQQEMLQRDVPFFLDHLSAKQRVLELAVGTGLAAIPIAQAGHRVVGIDNDAKMLERAERKREAAGLSERRLRLVHADLLDFDLNETFDWAALLFNTFLLFTRLEEQDRVLSSIRNHVKPRGRFWLDIFQPNLELLARDVSTDLEPMAFYVPELDRTVFKSTEVRRDPSKQVQRIIYHYTWFDAEGRRHHERSAFDLTFLFPRELQILLERNGLAIEHLYGDYDGRALDADSPRMIACCRRR